MLSPLQAPLLRTKTPCLLPILREHSDSQMRPICDRRTQRQRIWTGWKFLAPFLYSIIRVSDEGTLRDAGRFEGGPHQEDSGSRLRHTHCDLFISTSFQCYILGKCARAYASYSANETCHLQSRYAYTHRFHLPPGVHLH